ncbi:MAG: glycosyltransferase N-terminal domain-containing protein [bacterium]
MSFLYRCFTFLYVIPLAIVILLRVLLGRRDDLERLGLTLTARKSPHPLIWLVASSVGEVGVAVRLSAALKQAATVEIALTVTTPAGRLQAEKSREWIDYLYFQPFDLPCAVRSFLDRLRPCALVMIETELWPTLLTEAASRGIRLLQIAGRLSQRSLLRYLAMKPLLAPLLRRFAAILTQSQIDAQRFQRLGAPPERVAVVGSPKEEYQPPDSESLMAIQRLLANWTDGPLLVAGSTRPGEEDSVLSAYQTALKEIPQLKLVLAPRHLKRLPEVAALLERTGVSWQQRSNGAPARNQRVLLLDTIGELSLFYHLCDLAFVGGTLARLGGHNLLEPALAGVPVLHGPHVFNQMPGAESLTRHKLGHRVRDAEELAAAVVSLLRQGDLRGAVAARVDGLRNERTDVIDNYVRRILKAAGIKDA